MKKIVEYLQAQGSATIDRDDVKAYLKGQGVANADTITLSCQNLMDLKGCLAVEGINLEINIKKTRNEMADEERIKDEVKEHYEVQHKVVGNLSKEQACALAMYMRNQDGKTPKPVITSDSVKTEVASLAGTTLTCESLNDF